MRLHGVRHLSTSSAPEHDGAGGRGRRKELRPPLIGPVKLVLASRSPRRAELLRAAGFEFSVRVVDVDETPREQECPETYVIRLAEEKARAVKSYSDEIVLAADTTVVL